MAFDQTGIEARGYLEGVSLVVVWESSHADGVVYQVYLDRRLMWSGTSRRAVLPLPHEAASIDVGAVGAGESGTDFSASLPVVPTDRVRLTWTGGTYLGADLEGFRVYMGAAPGGAVSYATPVGTVAAYGAGIPTTRFGDGAFGDGAFGYPAAYYAWTSGRLASGTWNLGVRPYDSAGNEGAAQEVAVAVTAPPRPPAAAANGSRVAYSYSGSTNAVTLTWLASPA